MVKRVIRLFSRDFSGLHEAALLLGFFSLLSQFLALARDRLFAGAFGAGQELDIYYTAFRLPDLVYVTVASFVSVTVLIPFLAQKIEKQQEAEAKKLLSTIFSSFMVVMVLVSLVLYFLVPIFAPLIAPGFDQVALDKLISLTRIMLLSPILLGLSNLFASITQTYKKFLIYSLSPVLYNIGIIIGIVLFYPLFGLTGLAWGVILGAFFHLLIQVPIIISYGYWPKCSLNLIRNNFKDLIKIVTISFPRTITLSIHQLSLLVMIALASYLGKGVISIFNFSFNMQSVPLSIIGVSYSVAAFPTLARFYSSGQMEKFNKQIYNASRHIIFWSLPAMVLLIVLRAQIVRVVLGSGRFDWTATRLTAGCLAIFSVSVFAQGLILLFVRGYYASGQTKKPLLANSLSSLLMILLAFGLNWLFQTSVFFRSFLESLLRVEGIEGSAVLVLPLAFSSAMIVNVFILWFLFGRDFGHRQKELISTITHSFSSSVIGGFVAYESLVLLAPVFDLNSFVGIFSQGLIAGLAGLLATVLMLHLVGSRELKELIKSLHRRFWEAETVVIPEQEEL